MPRSMKLLPHLGILVWAASALPSLLPGQPGDLAFAWADQYADAPTLLLTVAAALVLAARIPEGPERRLWQLLASGMASWACVRGLYLWIPYEERGVVFNLATDVFYLVGYLLTALGLELGVARAGGDRVRRVEAVGLLVFGFFLLGYFTLAPSVFNPEAYESWVSSLTLYALFDAYLVLRLLSLARGARAESWGVAFPWLLVAFVLWFAGDFTEGLMYRGIISSTEPAEPADLLWMAPSLALFLAVCTRLRSLTTR